MGSAAPFLEPGRHLLGISAKSRDMAPELRVQGRRHRYDMMHASGRILYRPGVPAADQYRTVWCHRGPSVAETDHCAAIQRRTDGGGARLTQINRCGSVWLCPVCSMPVSEERRGELEAAMVRWIGQGGHVYLFTFTFPHERADSLEESLARLQKAMDKFRTGHVYRRLLREQYGVAGIVRGLEATWGPANGWHPHMHMLVFGKPGLLADLGMMDRLKSAWLDGLKKAGLLPPAKVSWAFDHALDIRGGDDAAAYVAKFGRDEQWGMSSELVRHQAKAGARALADFDGHVTPFQVLDWARHGDDTAWALWREFADAFHGKRQLVYSPGLKKELGIADRDDLDIANDDKARPEEEFSGVITRPQLSILHQRGALGELLELVARYGGGQDDIDAWIAEIGTRPRRGRGTLMIRGGPQDWDWQDFHARRREERNHAEFVS